MNRAEKIKRRKARQAEFRDRMAKLREESPGPKPTKHTHKFEFKRRKQVFDGDDGNNLALAWSAVRSIRQRAAEVGDVQFGKLKSFAIRVGNRIRGAYVVTWYFKSNKGPKGKR